jgi:hypothetical protein
VDRLGFDQVVVVEDEDDAAGDGRNLVDHRGQDLLGWGWRGCTCNPWGLKRAQRAFPNISLNRPQGSKQVDQKAGWVVVVLIEREPGDGYGRGCPAHCSDPFSDQRGLAKAGRGGNEGQHAGKPALRWQPRIQPLHQAWARYQLGPDGRNI